jgi:hypothetical protein
VGDTFVSRSETRPMRSGPLHPSTSNIQAPPQPVQHTSEANRAVFLRHSRGGGKPVLTMQRRGAGFQCLGRAPSRTGSIRRGCTRQRPAGVTGLRVAARRLARRIPKLEEGACARWKPGMPASAGMTVLSSPAPQTRNEVSTSSICSGWRNCFAYSLYTPDSTNSLNSSGSMWLSLAMKRMMRSDSDSFFGGL